MPTLSLGDTLSLNNLGLATDTTEKSISAIIGGTPVADPYGSITEICLNSPGSGYSDTANIVVYIGDGNTPGSGAKAGSVILDDTLSTH